MYLYFIQSHLSILYSANVRGKRVSMPGEIWRWSPGLNFIFLSFPCVVILLLESYILDLMAYAQYFYYYTCIRIFIGSFYMHIIVFCCCFYSSYIQFMLTFSCFVMLMLLLLIYLHCRRICIHCNIKFIIVCWQTSSRLRVIKILQLLENILKEELNWLSFGFRFQDHNFHTFSIFSKHFIPPLELLLLFSRIYSCRREICVMVLVAFPYIYFEWVDWCVFKYSMRLVVRNSIAMYQYYAQGMKNCILTVHKLDSQ